MDPNIIDYYIINCAIPSIITIENRYQIDFGKPECNVVVILWNNKIEYSADCSYYKCPLFRINFMKKEHQNFQHLSCAWHCDACEF